MSPRRLTLRAPTRWDVFYAAALGLGYTPFYRLIAGEWPDWTTIVIFAIGWPLSVVAFCCVGLVRR